MDSGAEERFLAAQADANEKRLDLEKKLLAMQQDFKDSMEKQQREFKQFQAQQAAAVAAAMGAAAGGVGGRAGAVGGSSAGSEAGSSEACAGRIKKKARVAGAGGKAAADAGDCMDTEDEEQEQEDKIPCQYPGCAKTFKICSTTSATISNHMRKHHPQDTEGMVLVSALCGADVLCVCVWCSCAVCVWCGADALRVCR